MILVTQGYENSIALEVFLKSYLCLSPEKQKLIILYTVKKSLILNLEALNLSYQLNDSELIYFGHKIKCQFVEKKISDTTDCLLSALNTISKNDVLFTLPSIKSEFFLGGKIVNGHTEFLRTFFKSQSLAMFFYSDRLKILLASDHIPISLISTYLNAELIKSKVINTLDRFMFKKVILSGINPHCGENGLLGSEDSIVNDSVKQLRIKYPKIDFIGPVAGDSLHHYQDSNNLLVYMFHDQGLSMFKSQSQGFSINYTLGLPFLRLSVDHGTAQDLFGKNVANYQSCLYGLVKAVEFHENKTKLYQSK